MPVLKACSDHTSCGLAKPPSSSLSALKLHRAVPCSMLRIGKASRLLPLSPSHPKSLSLCLFAFLGPHPDPLSVFVGQRMRMPGIVSHDRLGAGPCRGSRGPYSLLEWCQGDGCFGCVKSHWRSLPSTLCHSAARSEHSLYLESWLEFPWNLALLCTAMRLSSNIVELFH